MLFNLVHLLLSIVGIVITLLFVIGTHEAAHFATARLLGVKVLKFSLGFGKAFFSWRDKKGTEYVLAYIPLGGYVRMLGEGDEHIPPSQRAFAFNRQPFYKKFLIVLAGPLTNLICAFFLYWVVFVMGYVTVKPVIGQVLPRSIAAESGLKPNQEIISINHRTTASWANVLFRLLTHIGSQDHLSIEVKALHEKKNQTFLLDVSNWHMEGLTPDPLKSLGIEPYQPEIPLVIGTVIKDSPAAASSLHVGDKMLAVDHQTLNNWDSLITTIVQHPKQTLNFTIERDHHQLTVPVTIGSQRDLLLRQSGYLGIAPSFHWPPDLLHTVQYGPWQAIPHAWQELTDLTYFNLLLIGKMITGKVSLQTLGGPLTIFESAGEALNSGILAFISFLAFLSVSIGVINLLPVPGLDGGHLCFQLVEVVMRRPVPELVQAWLYRLGLIFVLLVLIQALVNDVLRWY